MDMNQSMNFISSPNSNSNPQVPNFMMPRSSFMLPDYNNYQQNMSTKQIAEEIRRSHLNQLQKQNLELFWSQQLLEMQNTTVGKSQHQLPLARVKRIMKSEGDVKMISADTPILFSKACELFIMELTLRSWMQTEECKRRTLQRCDIARAIRNDELLDFLQEVVPLSHDCQKEDESGGKTPEGGENTSTAEALNLPMMNNLSDDMISMIQQVPQQFMLDPSIMSSSEFQFLFPSKVSTKFSRDIKEINILLIVNR
ncbi:Nuclear transcription factor Y subunit C-2 [Morus notabilis]|uniref:Nuclear transcription factor Y subunit C-2 n=1 Tax=Morus notabilis TaxID=981085 RepID=W9SQ52_9ROSA|nr:Nuclear transcription factor Y subunit C-2 [Morus notabilis]